MNTAILKNLIFGLAVGVVTGAVTTAGAMVSLTRLEWVWPVAVIGTVIGAVGHYVKNAVHQTVENRTHTLRNRVERIQRDLGDIHGMVRLAPYMEKLPLPFGGGWALTGDSAALLAREVIVRQPATVLELGSGVSTLIVGQILARHGSGRLISVDHDARWAAKTRQYVEFLGLESVVTVVHAPLELVKLNGRHFQWYSLDAALLSTLDSIDLLIVDGPPRPSSDGETARFPAFPTFLDRLSVRAIVFVDDAARADEKAMIAEWLNLAAGWETEFFNTVDGVTIMSRSDSGAV